ncbi:Serine/threonine-protein kinase PLK2 [Harpegnathos saltator]|uniref:Serine/threonine-protein kinase PLK2 n=1 Tax=Harpegnathos saltator TaxID=610380 RepID=E2BJW3_HARSA|nr:Serine/threonine-protein kinase PLK2 [Harpegnathos saltator]
MTDVNNGNQYACKIIPKNRMQKIHMQKIAREIMIHKELNHVNVVQMHHYFEDNLNVYMLLEACPRKVSCVSHLPGELSSPTTRSIAAFGKKTLLSLVSSAFVATTTTSCAKRKLARGSLGRLV